MSKFVLDLYIIRIVFKWILLSVQWRNTKVCELVSNKEIEKTNIILWCHNCFVLYLYIYIFNLEWYFKEMIQIPRKLKGKFATVRYEEHPL